jgi:hypothetical protein
LAQAVPWGVTRVSNSGHAGGGINHVCHFLYPFRVDDVSGFVPMIEFYTKLNSVANPH